MLPLTPARLPRSTADRLLDGGTGPEPLRQLLGAAAAPAQADELGGEQAARLAFTSSAGLRPHPGVSPPNVPRRTRACTWIVAAKAIAAVALTAGASGVAVAATSSQFPDGRPDVSTHQESDPDSSSARPTVVVDRARSTAQQPDTGPAPEPSPGPPTRTAPTARSDQPDRSETNSVPDDNTPAGPPTVAPGNPQHTTGPANGNKKSTAKTPRGQQKEKEKEKENNGNSAGAKTDQSGKSDHVSDPLSDTAEQQQDAGQE